MTHYYYKPIYSFKNVQLLAYFITVFLFLGASCKKEEANPKVDNDGLTQDIRNIVSDSILNIIKSMGMPIYGGANPPLLSKDQLLKASYLESQCVLVNSNRPNDVLGSVVPDYEVSFQQQNNDNLTIKVDYVTGDETGNGIGSFIVGNNCDFSIFTSVNANINGSLAKAIYIYSGSLKPNGIENLQIANFMVDDMGDPYDVFIENGQGRVFYDSDAFSELVGTPTTWYTALPDCPCTLSEVRKLGKTLCPTGEWSITQFSDYITLPEFHYGAKYEARWTPNNGSKSGQQCTYDANEQLITGGIAAGSVDSIAPGITSIYEHDAADVQPWKALPCVEYMRIRPTNNALACKSNLISPISNDVNGIDNLKRMIGSMTCEEATLLIKSATETTSPIIDANLRNYIIGAPISLTSQECKIKLQAWKGSILCSSEPGLCLVLDKAINNL